MYLKIIIYKMPISVVFFFETSRSDWSSLLNSKLDYLQHLWRDKLASTFISLCEEKLRLDDNEKNDYFLQWHPTDMVQRGTITGHQEEGCWNQLSLTPSCLGRSDNEGIMGLGAAKDLLRHSTSSILFRMQIRCQSQFVF